MPIDGLFIACDFISVGEEASLLEAIGSAPRAPGPERNRIERYGPGVLASGYSSGTLVRTAVPSHLAWLCDRLDHGHRPDRPDAISVNEYLVGQHLGLHTDRDEAGEEISTLGLGSSADMLFQRGDDPPILVVHPQRSLMRMRGPCRYAPWRHSVLPVAAPRISIVFRRARAAATSR